MANTIAGTRFIWSSKMYSAKTTVTGNCRKPRRILKCENKCRDPPGKKSFKGADTKLRFTSTTAMHRRSKKFHYYEQIIPT